MSSAVTGARSNQYNTTVLGVLWGTPFFGVSGYVQCFLHYDGWADMFNPLTASLFNWNFHPL